MSMGEMKLIMGSDGKLRRLIHVQDGTEMDLSYSVLRDSMTIEYDMQYPVISFSLSVCAVEVADDDK